MKFALLLWLSVALAGCETVKEREVIRFRTLPPKVIEKVIYVIPELPPVPRMGPKDSDSFA